jgi:hypothetical protein
MVYVLIQIWKKLIIKLNFNGVPIKFQKLN